MEEEEVMRCLESYLKEAGVRHRRGIPDVEFEDGSAIEAKGRDWPDVGAVMGQLADYYMTRPSLGFAAPADALTIDRAYRLVVLEKALVRSKLQGKPITIYCVAKDDGSYKLLKFDSAEDLFKQVTEELGVTAGVDRWLQVDEKVKRIGERLRKPSDALFREQLRQIVVRRGAEVKAPKTV